MSKRAKKYYKLRNNILVDCVCPAILGLDFAFFIIYALEVWSVWMTATVIIINLILAIICAICEPPKKGGLARKFCIIDDEGFVLSRSERKIYKMERDCREFNYMPRKDRVITFRSKASRRAERKFMNR